MNNPNRAFWSDFPATLPPPETVRTGEELMSETPSGAACKMSEVPIGAHVRHPSTVTWQQVADVVRVRDGSGNIRLTFADGDRLVASPNEPVEIRATDEGA